MTTEIDYVYGKNSVREALLARPDLVKTVHLSADFSDTGLMELMRKLKIARASFDPKKLPKGVAEDAVHQGIIAHVDFSKLLVPYDEFISSLSVTNDTGLILLGEVQDPQNVGSIVRSAAAFGISGILIPEHRQAQIQGTVAKVSSGMVFRIPLVQVGNVNHTLEDLKKRGFWTYGLDQKAEQSVYTEDFEKASVFVVGNESEGIREKTLEHCDIPLTIPMRGTTESLNAAVATAVVLSHWSNRHPGVLA
jgi:23S rRNA (guanosine2251-2'-O)-methyltransferase